jgi:hypothetical protein
MTSFFQSVFGISSYAHKPLYAPSKYTFGEAPEGDGPLQRSPREEKRRAKKIKRPGLRKKQRKESSRYLPLKQSFISFAN